MYVITDHSDVIIKISKTLDYQSNGNPLVDGGSMAIAKILVGAVSKDIDIPGGVKEYTHMYVDGEFKVNPDYIPPGDVITTEEATEAYREGVNSI